MPENKPEIFALNPAYIEGIHDQVLLVRFPGTEPVSPNEYRDRGLIASAALRPFQTAFEQELHPSTMDKAAALFHSLIANHPFHNGNKRTAAIAVDLFLLANDLFLAMSNDQLLELARETATYRERGASHKNMLSRIRQELDRQTVTFEAIKSRVFVETYEQIRRAQDSVRMHPLNKITPP